MPKPTIPVVAVVGTGVIGRSWIQVFARAGCRTRIYDRDPAQRAQAMTWLDADLKRSVKGKFLSARVAAAMRKRVSDHSDLSDALDGVGYAQESGPERVDLKQKIYAELDGAAAPGIILGSSTSTLDMTEIASGLKGANRCVVAHPTNPPHIVPCVEVLGGAATDPKVVTRTVAFLKSVGQTPVLMNKYIYGFMLNRMQAALIREAINLVEGGVADVDAVDSCIRDGLGLRWALMGPFGVGNTNADGGIRAYYEKYGEAYIGLFKALETPSPSFNPGLIDRVSKGTKKMLGNASVPDMLRWRDRMIRKIRALKAEDRGPY